MENILSRIQDIAKNEGITIGALERKIGASKGVLSRAINNGTDIQSKWLQIIAHNYPQYSTRWLMTGQGSMLTNSGITGDLKSFEDKPQSYLIDKIAEQAEEIGRLKARVDELERHRGNDASDVSSGLAHAG